MTDIQEVLLAQLAGDPVDVAPSMPDLVAQTVGDDPVVAKVLEALQRRAEREAASTEPEASDLAIEDEGGTEPSGNGVDVDEILQRLWGEVEDLRERTQRLADALGACPRCWGEDVWCPRCHGRGRSGGRVPDPLAFAALVEPAAARAGLTAVRTQSTTPPGWHPAEPAQQGDAT